MKQHILTALVLGGIAGSVACGPGIAPQSLHDARDAYGEAERSKANDVAPVKLEEAEYDEREYDDGLGVADLADQVVFQDWQLTAGQRAGWRSRGYQEPYLAAQETRVRRFHEVLNDYLAGDDGRSHAALRSWP